MIKLSNLSGIIKPSLTRKLFNMAKQYDDVIDFTLGDPDILPHERIREAGCQAIMSGKTRYSQNAGLIELRDIISKKYFDEYGIDYDPLNEVIVTVGGMEGLYLALLGLINADDEVIIPAPYWINYSQMVQMCGGRPVFVNSVSETDLSISVENIEASISKKTKAIIINTPSNPSGIVVKKDELERIAELANKYDIVVIADEVYKKLVYDDNVFCSISTMPGMKERTVLVNSLSKEFSMTGWRLGYVAAPKELIALMTMLQENVAACAPLPSQYAAIEALSHSGEYSREMIAKFAARKEVLVEECNKINKISLRLPEATFYAMLNIKNTGLKSEDFAYRLLESQHVAVVPGITYGSCCEGFVRIAFTIEEELIRTGIRRLAAFVNDEI